MRKVPKRAPNCRVNCRPGEGRRARALNSGAILGSDVASAADFEAPPSLDPFFSELCRTGHDASIGVGIKQRNKSFYMDRPIFLKICKTCEGWRVRFSVYLCSTYLEILEVPRQRKRLGPLLAQAVKGRRHLFSFLVGLERRREVREGEAAAEHVRVIIAAAASVVLVVGEKAEAEKEAAVAVGGGRQLLKQKPQSTLPQSE